MSEKEAKPVPYQVKFEKELIEEVKRSNWNATESVAWKRLTNKFGPKITTEELLSLAQVAAKELGLELTREYKRRKVMLIYWFDQQNEEFWKFLDKHIVVFDREGRPINTLAP